MARPFSTAEPLLLAESPSSPTEPVPPFQEILVIMDYGSSGEGYVIMGCDVLLYKRHGDLIHV